MFYRFSNEYIYNGFNQILIVPLLLYDTLSPGQEFDECGCPDTWVRFNGSCYMIGYQQRMYFMEAEVTTYTHFKN